MNVAVIGTGYVGLVCGVCLAEMGNDVSCVDTDESKVAKLRAGELTLYEPGLEPSFERGLRDGRLRFTTSMRESVRRADVVMLALPTPTGEDGAADLSHVLGVACQLGPMLNGYTVVAVKSTVPIGTAERIEAAVGSGSTRAGIDFDVVSNPELRQAGNAMAGVLSADRVIVGAPSDRAAAVMLRLYEPFARRGSHVLTMDRRSAEIAKYATDALWATKAAFLNETAQLCAFAGADIDSVSRALAEPDRDGRAFLRPGLSLGNGCAPRDLRAFEHTAAAQGCELRLVRATLEIGAEQVERLLAKVAERFDGDLQGRRLALWGLALAAHTDDVRESPALRVARGLIDRGARVVAFDPEAMAAARAQLGHTVTYAPGVYEALTGADGLIVCTDWPVFRGPDLTLMRRLLAQPVVFDGCSLYGPEAMANAGLEYHCSGKLPGSTARAA